MHALAAPLGRYRRSVLERQAGRPATKNPTASGKSEGRLTPKLSGRVVRRLTSMPSSIMYLRRRLALDLLTYITLDRLVDFRQNGPRPGDGRQQVRCQRPGPLQRLVRRPGDRRPMLFRSWTVLK